MHGAAARPTYLEPAMRLPLRVRLTTTCCDQVGAAARRNLQSAARRAEDRWGRDGSRAGLQPHVLEACNPICCGPATLCAVGCNPMCCRVHSFCAAGLQCKPMSHRLQPLYKPHAPDAPEAAPCDGCRLRRALWTLRCPAVPRCGSYSQRYSYS